MRRIGWVLLPLLAGCAGNVADYIGPRSTIVAQQLTRFGLNLRESRCVGERLGAGLTPLQLRRFERAASSVTRGYFDPDRLGVRDLMHVAGSIGDPQVRLELARATAACAVTEVAARREPAEEARESARVAAPAAAHATPRWVNLGSVPAGQGIAFDAASLEQGATTRSAWFRLLNPESPPSGISYFLRIDCTARTIAAEARRTHDAAGAMTEYRPYSGEDAQALPVEGGTVMEIAWLAMCT